MLKVFPRPARTTSTEAALDVEDRHNRDKEVSEVLKGEDIG